MSRPFHKPVRRPSDVIDGFAGEGDPAELTAIAHDTAAALLHRVRANGAPATITKLIDYADTHGVDDIAELWATADAVSLPGAMWRLYLLRHTVTEDPAEAAHLFGRGLEARQVEQAVVGASNAPTPDETVALATEILRGAFAGDFGIALDRAAAFCRVMSHGSSELATADDNPRRARGEAIRGARYQTMANDLSRSAGLWRIDELH